MMLNANANNSHYKTLKGWTKSAEYSRVKLLEQLKEASSGSYKVRMEHSDAWEPMRHPPAAGACEWLYLDENGVPIYYWNKDSTGLTII